MEEWIRRMENDDADGIGKDGGRGINYQKKRKSKSFYQSNIFIEISLKLYKVSI